VVVVSIYGYFYFKIVVVLPSIGLVKLSMIGKTMKKKQKKLENQVVQITRSVKKKSKNALLDYVRFVITNYYPCYND